MAESETLVKVRPDKRFFVDMLTKDITLTDCILDLIDNGVDAYVEKHGTDVMALLLNGKQFRRRHARIDIRYDPSRFRISDTCGGMTIDEVRNRAFLLGNPASLSPDHGLSVYGIGMKRAIFKLGRFATIASQSAKGRFTLPFDVTGWLNSPSWDLHMDSVDPRATPTTMRPAGSDITVTQLIPDVQSRLRQTTFRAELEDRISATYALFIEAGVEITINGRHLKPALPTISSSKQIQPARRLLKEKSVEILIIVGASPASDPNPHGWYVFCNGRMVLEADRTEVTGWGEQLPRFHSKFNHFVGYVYFRSDDPRDLPWRTTKQGVDRDSHVYQVALQEMALQGRKVTSFLSNQYPSELEEELPVERDVLRGATAVALTKLPRSEQTFKLALPSRPRKREMVSIQYERTLQQVGKVRDRIGKPRLSARKVGEYTFDYFLKMEGGD